MEKKFGMYRVHKNWFGFVTFWPLVTLKIRSHNSKSNQFLRHSKGIFTSSIIEFGPVVWLDQVHKVWETTDNLRDLSDLDIQDGRLKLSLIQHTKQGCNTKLEVAILICYENCLWLRYPNLTYLTSVTLEARSHTPTSNKFIIDH